MAIAHRFNLKVGIMHTKGGYLLKNETLLLTAIQCATLGQLTELVATYLDQTVLIADQSGTIISQSDQSITTIPDSWLDPLAPDARYQTSTQELVRILLNPQALRPWYLFVSQSKGYPLAQPQLQLVIQVINNFTDRYALNPNQGEVNALFAQLLTTPEQTDTQLLQTLTHDKLICAIATAHDGATPQPELLTTLRQLTAPLPLTETTSGLVFLFPAAQLNAVTHQLEKLGHQFQHDFFLSEPFADMTKAAEFLTICRQARAIAQQLGTIEVVNLTQKYNIYIILSHVENTALLRNTMCTQLMTLKQYDERHHAELFPTLYTFLENACHVSNTAAKLHLHRNSLSKRLGKIQDLIDVDFNNSDKTFGLRLSYRLFHFLNL